MKLIKLLGKRKYGNFLVLWAKFLCLVCLQEVERPLSNGRKQKSCGCHKNIKHGGFGTRLYKIWEGMKSRCLNSNRKAYKNYGGRGITICNEWLEFIPFRDWALSNGYAEGLQIHRENDGNYEPYSCRWVTNTENARQKRKMKIKNIEIANEIRGLWNTGNYTQKELAEKYSIDPSHVSRIIRKERWV